MKKIMFEKFSNNETSEDQQDTEMYFAMLAYEEYGCATRDNTFEELVAIGKELENETR